MISHIVIPVKVVYSVSDTYGYCDAKQTNFITSKSFCKDHNPTYSTTDQCSHNLWWQAICPQPQSFSIILESMVEYWLWSLTCDPTITSSIPGWFNTLCPRECRFTSIASLLPHSGIQSVQVLWGIMSLCMVHNCCRLEGLSLGQNIANQGQTLLRPFETVYWYKTPN